MSGDLVAFLVVVVRVAFFVVVWAVLLLLIHFVLLIAAELLVGGMDLGLRHWLRLLRRLNIVNILILGVHLFANHSTKCKF